MIKDPKENNQFIFFTLIFHLMFTMLLSVDPVKSKFSKKTRKHTDTRTTHEQTNEKRKHPSSFLYTWTGLDFFESAKKQKNQGAN